MLESKRRAMIFLILAFILAAIAGYLVFDKVRKLNAELGGMTKIYVAAGDIPSRTLITENQVKTMEIPNRYVSESSYVTKLSDIVNQVVVVPLSKGNIITPNMLKPATELRKANDRLVAMYRSDKIQFDQVVTTNDRVDIIVSTEENGQKSTEIFMRDVPVAWAQGSGSKFVGAALEVSLDQAPKLINVENYADHVRVLKANVGKDDGEESTPIAAEQTNQNKEVNKKQETPANNKESTIQESSNTKQNSNQKDSSKK